MRGLQDWLFTSHHLLESSEKMTTTEEKRLFIGGLVKGVTEEELVEKFSRFGQVRKVEVKTRATDADCSKTFAYLNLTAEDKAFKRCLTAYNNSKWKGGHLTVQLARESFLSKLKKEQAEGQTCQQSRPACVQRSPALDTGKAAVPGTPLDGNGWWVMGKYSRVVPVMRLRKPGSRKLITVDPSQTPHCLKKLRSEGVEEQQLSGLTWELEESSTLVNKLRQGQFLPRHHSTPTQPSPLPPQSIASRLQGLAAEEQESDTEMEVVPVGPMKTPPTPRAHSRYDSDSSASSADTDEIVCKASGKNCVVTAVNHGTAIKENDNNAKSSVQRPAQCRDISSQSREKTAPVHPDSRRESSVKGPQLNGEDPRPEGQSTPHLQFVKTPKVNGKAREKSVPLSQRKSTFVENSNEDVKLDRADNRSVSKKTPEFKGLGMLSSDGEDSLSPEQNRNSQGGSEKIRNSQGGSEKIRNSQGGSEKIRNSQGGSEKIRNSQGGSEKIRNSQGGSEQIRNSQGGSEKIRNSQGGSEQRNNQGGSEKNRNNQGGSEKIRNSQGGSEKIRNSQGGSVLCSAREPSVSPARSADGGSGRKSSLPVLPHKRKRSAAVSSDDSDLDDNDFEKVGKRLAARAAEGAGRRGESVDRGGRRGESMDRGGGGTAAVMETPTTSEASGHLARTRETTQGEEEHMTSMDRSHRAYRKQQQQQKQKESLITKTLREGTGSTHITFSDSAESEGNEEKSAHQKAGKLSLFNEDESDDDSGTDLDFSIRPQFEGKKGRKLLDLQSRITDKRFHFDERFQSDGESEAMEMDLQQGSDDDLAKEKEQNLKILEKVLGHKPQQRTRLVYEAMSKKRYNPQSADNPVFKNKPKKRMKPDWTEPVESPTQNHSERNVESDASSSHCEQDAESDASSSHCEQDAESDASSSHCEQDAESDASSSHCEQDAESDASSSHWEQDAESDASSSHWEQDAEADGPGSEPMKQDWECDTDNTDDTDNNTDDTDNNIDDTDNNTVSRHAQHGTEEGGTEGDTESDTDDTEGDTDDTESDTVSRPTQHGEEEDGSVPELPAPGEGLKDLFGGGSSFTFFGAPDSRASEETQAVSAFKSVDLEEEEDDSDDEEEVAVERKSRPQEADSSQVAAQQPSFLVARNDPRLLAAVRFFRRPSPEEFEELSQRWPEERQKVMQVVRERHKKACRKHRQLKQGVKSRTLGKTKSWTLTKGKK